MAQFTYTAKDKSGEVLTASATARNKSELYSQIRKQGLELVEVHEEKKSWFSLDKFNELFGVVKEHEKITLTRNLGAMVEAGLSLTRALTVLERQTKNQKLKMVLTRLGNDIKGGNNFHSALKKFPKVFSPLFVSMVRAGEESGDFSGALTLIGSQLERSRTLKKKIKGAMIYPSIVLGAMVVIAVLMLIFVVPTLTSTFEEFGADLPRTTQGIISVSKFFIENTLLALLVPIMLGTLFFSGLKTYKGRRMFHYVLLRTPIIGELIKEIQSARTTRTLSSLLSSGVEVVKAISITGDVVQNSYYKDVLLRAGNDVQKGTPLSVAFSENEHLYPILVGEMISVGEETGKLSEMLLRVAEFYESEVEQKTKDMSTIVEPFLMIIIGTFVGFFAISMIAPIYSLSGTI